MARTYLMFIVGGALVALSNPVAAQAKGLEGRWKSVGGEIEVRHCTEGKGLCVVVASGDNSKESMASMVGNVVARDIVPTAPNQWKGRYVAENKDLVATIRLISPDVTEMRVCLLSWFPYLLCETPTYRRVGQ